MNKREETAIIFGVQLSSEECLLWGQDVQGSNPCTPTKYYREAMEDIKYIKKIRSKDNTYYPYYDKYTKSLCIPMVAGETVYYLEIPRSVILELLKDEQTALIKIS